MADEVSIVASNFVNGKVSDKALLRQFSAILELGILRYHRIFSFNFDLLDISASEFPASKENLRGVIREMLLER